MIFLILVILSVLWLLGTYVADKYDRSNDYISARTTAAVLIVISLILCCVVTSGFHIYFIKNKESIITYENKMKIYQDKMDNLYAQYSAMLDTSYKDYESGVFNKISKANEGSNVSVNVYPQMKYNETLSQLSKRLDELTASIYNCRLNIEDAKLNLRIIKHNPFILQLFIPEI